MTVTINVTVEPSTSRVLIGLLLRFTVSRRDNDKIELGKFKNLLDDVSRTVRLIKSENEVSLVSPILLTPNLVN